MPQLTEWQRKVLAAYPPRFYLEIPRSEYIPQPQILHKWLREKDIDPAIANPTPKFIFTGNPGSEPKP